MVPQDIKFALTCFIKAVHTDTLGSVKDHDGWNSWPSKPAVITPFTTTHTIKRYDLTLCKGPFYVSYIKGEEHNERSPIILLFP